MNGYQITFFTQQGHRHGHDPLDRWLIELAKSLGIGATSAAGMEGIDHSGRMHSAHFIELADQPVIVTLVATEEQAQRLLDTVAGEVEELFYVKTRVEFGHIGTAARSA